MGAAQYIATECSTRGACQLNPLHAKDKVPQTLSVSTYLYRAPKGSSSFKDQRYPLRVRIWFDVKVCSVRDKHKNLLIARPHLPDHKQAATMLTHTLLISFFYLLTSSFCSALSLRRDGYANDTQSSLPDYAKRNLDTIRKIYNLTVYPNNVPIVNRGVEAVPPGLFNQDATGRVSPVGNFTGFADSIEYFFALAPTPQLSNGIGFYAAEVVEFTSGCAEVAASLVYLRTAHFIKTTGEIDNSKPKSTLSQVR